MRTLTSLSGTGPTKEQAPPRVKMTTALWAQHSEVTAISLRPHQDECEAAGTDRDRGPDNDPKQQFLGAAKRNERLDHCDAAKEDRMHCNERSNRAALVSLPHSVDEFLELGAIQFEWH
jgi:hypothetical protein